jgi:hypothetical protein
MNDLPDGTLPHPGARATGVVWLLYFVIGILGTILMKGIVVPADAAATATNLLARATAYRAGSALDLLANCLYIVLTVGLYGVFRRVDRNVALLAMVFSLAGCVTQIFGALLRSAPFVLLVDNQPFSAFSAQQLAAAALLSLRMFNRVFDISFVLFAFFEMVTGYLILRSPFLPRWLGWLWILAGIGAATFLWPPLATSIFPGIIALNSCELILAGWLIVKGPGIDRWREQRSG